MTDRERFIATLTFQKPDRVPFEPGTARSGDSYANDLVF
jgi:hypothetical protein